MKKRIVIPELEGFVRKQLLAAVVIALAFLGATSTPYQLIASPARAVPTRMSAAALA